MSDRPVAPVAPVPVGFDLVMTKLVEIAGSVGEVKGEVSGLRATYAAHEANDESRHREMTSRFRASEISADTTQKRDAKATLIRAAELEREARRSQGDLIVLAGKRKLADRRFLQTLAISFFAALIAVATSLTAHYFGIAAPPPAHADEPAPHGGR